MSSWAVFGGMTYRGNVTYRSSIGGTSCMQYEVTGVVVSAQDGAGHVMNSAPSADTSYSLPGTLTPGGASNLATTVTYDSTWAVTSVTGPNGANGTTTYDQYGRPQKTKIPDGAETNYTYTYVPMYADGGVGDVGRTARGSGRRWTGSGG